MENLFETSGAHFSEERKYRYYLWRIWDKSLPFIMFIGLNPSTANESKNDPTIRRVISFAKDWGYGGVYMLNLFPLVSTDPSILNTFYTTDSHDSEQELNNIWLSSIGSECKEVIFAWGAPKIARDRAEKVKAMFPRAKALKLNADGSPGHPLYVRSDTYPRFFDESIQNYINDCKERSKKLTQGWKSRI